MSEQFEEIRQTLDGPYREIWCGCGVPEERRPYRVLHDEWEWDEEIPVRTIHRWAYAEESA